jgi:hypothetical protein
LTVLDGLNAAGEPVEEEPEDDGEVDEDDEDDEFDDEDEDSDEYDEG